MRHRLFVPCSAALVAFCLSTVTMSAQTSPAEREVMQTIEKINAAFQARDVKAFEALTTADFVRVTSAGRALTKAEWLKTVAAPGATRAAGKYDQVSVRVYGNGAVVTYRGLPAAGADPDANSYLTRVMEKQGTQWKMALAQSTELRTPPPPTGAEPPALPPSPATTAAAKAALSAFQAVQKANAARDLAAWEKLSAPDHVIIGADAIRTTRAERVAALKSPATGPATAVIAEQQVRVVVKGDVAAVTWVSGSNRALKVLALNGGQWQQVLQQSTPMIAAKK